jgi:hypothetical protein
MRQRFVSPESLDWVALADEGPSQGISDTGF